MTVKLGFVGTGTITAHMVRGLKASPLADWPVILSPRNNATARALAKGLLGVTVAADNQAVVDAADVVILAVRPQVAEAVLRDLTIRADVQVISLIAATSSARIAEWTGAAQVCRAVPLPFVEGRSDVVPVFPPHPMAMQIFDALGRAMPVQDQESFDLYAALSALMGSYFGILDGAAEWATGHGLSDKDARTYLAGLFQNLGQVAARSTHSFGALRHDHSTAGGLNEQVFTEFSRKGGMDALTGGLDSVLRRITGKT